jgi:hypothetical protein
MRPIVIYLWRPQPLTGEFHGPEQFCMGGYSVLTVSTAVAASPPLTENFPATARAEEPFAL